jgi:hypothetical protein
MALLCHAAQGAAPSVGAAPASIPAIVMEHPDYKALFKDAPVKIHTEGLLSPTRRFLVLDGNLMLFVVLDLNRNTNRWEVSFSRAVKDALSGFNSRMTIWHQGNQLGVAWQSDGTNVTFTVLRADDQTPSFREFKYSESEGYDSFYWENGTDTVVGLRYNTRGGVEINSLDGKSKTTIPIALATAGPKLFRQYDATAYRLWVTKSERPLALGDSGSGESAYRLNCVTLRKTAAGFEVVSDKFVTMIYANAPRGGPRGYLDVEDKGTTYKLLQKTFPMSGGSNYDKDLGEFAY